MSTEADGHMRGFVLGGTGANRITSITRSLRVSNRRLRTTGWAPRYPSVCEGWTSTASVLRAGTLDPPIRNAPASVALPVRLIRSQSARSELRGCAGVLLR